MLTTLSSLYRYGVKGIQLTEICCFAASRATVVDKGLSFLGAHFCDLMKLFGDMEYGG